MLKQLRRTLLPPAEPWHPLDLRFDGVVAHLLYCVAIAGVGAAVLPAVAIVGAPVHAAVWQAVVAAAIALGAAWLVSRLDGGRFGPLLGVAISGAAAWLLAQVSYPVGAWIIAPMLGCGIGLVCPTPGARLPRWSVAVPLAIATLLVIIRFAAARDVAMASGAVVVAISAATWAWTRSPGTPMRRRVAIILASTALLSLFTTAYVGATTPGVTWFGSLVHHGSRQSNMVAVTFDDGPNPPFTIEIRDILDQHGVKGTFFTVGKALEARPDVSRALLDDGQLLGNHSYNHDAFRWLDPAYPELRDTEDAFKRTLGVCPAFYRPPHGSHTPFMAHVVDNAGMTMVTWDVSAADWATADGELVARRVLDKVKPGSIILLHDGIDGNIGADRSVILTALPIILNGLKARGLEAVTLDKLLGKPGYLDNC